jgi:hypothetical protein
MEKDSVLETPLAHKQPPLNVEEFSGNSDQPHKRQRPLSPTPEPGIDNGEEPPSWIPQTSGAPLTPPEHVNQLPRELASHVPQSDNPLWRTVLEEHHRFKLYNYMSYTAGTYMIQCPLLETRYPDLVGQLSITIKFLGASSITSGVLEAYINFGKFVGPAVFALDSDRAAEWLWATATERRGKRALAFYENSEVERLCEDALDVAIRRTPTRKRSNLETSNLRDFPALEIDISRLAQFEINARLNNPTGEYYGPDVYRVIFGEISFSEHGFRFDGVLTIPELTEINLEFAGFKVFQKNQGDLPQRWIDVPTSKVQF